MPKTIWKRLVAVEEEQSILLYEAWRRSTWRFFLFCFHHKYVAHQPTGHLSHSNVQYNYIADQSDKSGEDDFKYVGIEKGQEKRGLEMEMEMEWVVQNSIEKGQEKRGLEMEMEMEMELEMEWVVQNSIEKGQEKRGLEKDMELEIEWVVQNSIEKGQEKRGLEKDMEMET